MEKKLKSLKVGDTIVIYEPYSTRFVPVEGEITKVGRQYVHAKCKSYSEYKFTKETGYGEYGRSLFPGTLKEYHEYAKMIEYSREVSKYIDNNRKNLTREALDKIMLILKELENENN